MSIDNTIINVESTNIANITFDPHDPHRNPYKQRSYNWKFPDAAKGLIDRARKKLDGTAKRYFNKKWNKWYNPIRNKSFYS